MQSVTYGEIEEVYNALKGSRFAKISVDALTDGVLCSLEISDKNRILVKNGVKKFFRIWDKMRLNRSVPADEVKLEVCLTVPDESDEENELEGTEAGLQMYRISLLELKSKSARYQRTKPIIAFLEDQAKKNIVSVNELIGIITKQINYHTEKRSSTADIAEKLIKGEAVSLMPMDLTCHLQQSLSLGRTGYQLLKSFLKKCDEEMSTRSIKLPAWKNLRDHQKSIIPAVRLSASGVRVSYLEALNVTIQRILSLPDVKVVGQNLLVQIKDSADGSGGHSIYHQLNNKQTHNMIMFMFCVLSILEEDTGTVIFKEQLVASPFAMRPVFLVLGK